MQGIERDRELILGVLTHRGMASSPELQAATGKSQATISRLLAGLSRRVLTLDSARATRYALPREIRGLSAQQPIFWTGEEGSVQQIGVLSFLATGLVHIASDHLKTPPASGVPWALAPLKASGFLGRLHAQRLQAVGIEGDPDRWDTESVLFSALHMHDPPGAITLGETMANAESRFRLPGAGVADLKRALDKMATDVAQTLPAGSSAGGEQPKFLAVFDSGQHVLVKFTPPRGTPFGERWHDLLHAEHVAGQVLAAHGVTVANTRIVETGDRTYLLSDRFDRLGEHGRRHVVTIGDAHQAFVPSARAHWGATAEVLARQNRLSKLDAERINALRGFGQLIGNTDMHFGNLGLFVTLEDLPKGRFGLAPVYDMLPMCWRPNPNLGGADDYSPFEPGASSLSSPARPAARDFWTRLAASRLVSRDIRQVAGEMARRLR